MRNAARGLLAGLMAALGWIGYAQDAPPDEKPLPMAKVGIRTFDVDGKPYRIPWYRVEVDYNETQAPRKELARVVKPDGSVTAHRPLNWWDRIVTPAGTVTACVGGYEEIRFTRSDGKTEARLAKWGVDFTRAETRPVKPGPGKVHLHYWLFGDAPRDDGMQLKEDRLYVFCLDRQPVERWKYQDGEPACDLDGELDHVVAIIEIRPTFDFSRIPRTEAPCVTADSLISFRETSRDDPKDTCSIVRGGDGKLRFERGDGNSAPAKDETVRKLLYALNTAGWHRIEAPGEADTRSPPAGIAVEFKDADGKVRRIVEGHARDPRLLVAAGRTNYATRPPDLLMEVAADIRAACAKDAGAKDRKE